MTAAQLRAATLRQEMVMAAAARIMTARRRRSVRPRAS
jgi:hypothetical protein